MENIASHTDPDFGKEVGLFHEMLITGRKVGATKDFFVQLAHDQSKFRRALDAVHNGKVFRVRGVPRFEQSVVEELRKYPKLPTALTQAILGQFATLEFPQEDFEVTQVGGFPDELKIKRMRPFLFARGYRPLTVPEAMLLIGTDGFIPDGNVDGYEVCHALETTPIPLQRRFGNGIEKAEMCFPLFKTSRVSGHERMLCLHEADESIFGLRWFPAIKL